MHGGLSMSRLVLLSLLLTVSFLIIKALRSPTPPRRATAQSSSLNCRTNPGRLTCFEAWRQSFTTGIYSTDADMNSSGTVTLADFEVWRRSFTGNISSQPSPTSSVAPPTISPTSSNIQPMYQSNFESGTVGTCSLGTDCWSGIRVDSNNPGGDEHLVYTYPGLNIPPREGSHGLRIHADQAEGTTRVELEGYNLPFFDLKTEYWVGWSIYLPADGGYDFDSQNEILTQFRHRNDSSCAASGVSPPNSLRPLGGRWNWDVRGHGGCDSNTVEIIDMGPQVRGKWTDFVARFYFSSTNDGIVQVWVDGTLMVDRINQVNYFRNSRGPYMKIGFYKSKWLSSASSVTTRTLYYDAVKVFQGSNGYTVVTP